MNKQTNSREPFEEESDIFSDSDDLSKFKRDLTTGQLRWLSTILAIANLGLLIFLAFDSEEPAIYFPVLIKGQAVWWILSGTLMAWFALAVKNWLSWVEKKRL
jgi:hypothetical protein